MKLTTATTLLLSLLQVTSVLSLAIPESTGHDMKYRDDLQSLSPAGNLKRRVQELEMRSEGGDPDGGDKDPGDGGDHAPGDGGGDGATVVVKVVVASKENEGCGYGYGRWGSYEVNQGFIEKRLTGVTC